MINGKFQLRHFRLRIFLLMEVKVSVTSNVNVFSVTFPSAPFCPGYSLNLYKSIKSDESLRWLIVLKLSHGTAMDAEGHCSETETRKQTSEACSSYK